MKKLSKDSLKFLFLVATIMIVGVGVAYAALSTTLSITFGSVTQSALSWNVGFQGNSATATSSGTSDTGRVCGTATITPSTVTVADTTLSKPGDKCTYALTVANTGTVGAVLSSITPTAPNGITCGTSTGGNLVCGNITYKLTSDAAGETVLPTSTDLAAGSTQAIYLVISYNADTLQTTEVTHTGAKFTLTYNQA